MNPEWVDESEYPFSPRYFRTEAGHLHYVDEGSGNPVVMVHGNPDWSFSYRKIILQLSDTHRCIAVDHIGFGLSDKPINWSYLPVDHAKNFSDLMDSLDLENITLMVNDWGGPIGLAYAIANPHRVKKIILLNSWLWSTNDDWYYRAFSGFMGGFVGRYLIKNHNFFAKVVLKKAYADKSKLTKEVHQQYLKPLEKKEERKSNWVFPKQIIDSGEWLDTQWRSIDNIKNKPFLLLWGLKDIAFRKKELNTWKSTLTNYELHTFPNAGHYPHEEESQEVISLMKNFIN